MHRGLVHLPPVAHHDGTGAAARKPTLGLRAEPGSGSRARLVYEPGVQLSVHALPGGVVAIGSEWLGDPTAAPVTQELARHVIGGTSPPRHDGARMPGASRPVELTYSS